MFRVLGLTALLAGLAPVAAAQTLPLPRGAVQTHSETDQLGSHALPLAPWTDNAGFYAVPVEGRVQRQAWRVDNTQATPLQLMAPLRVALAQAGFDIVLDCAARACGGFDFRFAAEVVPAPAMFVNLTRFRYLSARNADGGAVSVLTSSTDDTAWIQIVQVGVRAATTTTQRVVAAPASRAASTIARQLEDDGHVILSDLDFASGAARLQQGSIASLDDLAAYLVQNPDRQVVFVGHTDATGSLEINTRLSRTRAQAVVDYLLERHDVPRQQIAAEGVGYLAPIASNLTAGGREANRRVEAVLVSTR